MAIAGHAVGGREGMRQAAQPLPEDGVDLVGGQGVGDLLDGRTVPANESIPQLLRLTSESPEIPDAAKARE